MTFLFSRGKTNGLLKFQSYLVSGFGVIAIDKKNKTSELYSAYTKNIYRCSFNRSYLSSATGYRVGTCVILFIMNWGIIIFDLNILMLSSKEAVQA